MCMWPSNMDLRSSSVHVFQYVSLCCHLVTPGLAMHAHCWLHQPMWGGWTSTLFLIGRQRLKSPVHPCRASRMYWLLEMLYGNISLFCSYVYVLSGCRGLQARTHLAARVSAHLHNLLLVHSNNNSVMLRKESIVISSIY